MVHPLSGDEAAAHTLDSVFVDLGPRERLDGR